MEKTIDCTCGQKHVLVIDIKYDRVMYARPPKNITKLVEYDLIYTCPVKSIQMEITVQFQSDAYNIFQNAAVIEVK